jgi:hypothetical protein
MQYSPKSEFVCHKERLNIEIFGYNIGLHPENTGLGIK